jgi:Ca2+-binding EF-hand superfamily protein
MNTLHSATVARKVELHDDFERCDANRDGQIDYKEFCTLLKNLEADVAGAELCIGFYKIDTNHDDLIDYPEFRNWWLDH